MLQLLLIKLLFDEFLALQRGQFVNAFVEALDRYPALIIVKGGEQRHECVQCVRHTAAKRSGVEIGVRGEHRDLHRT
ncbi:hypothetical protein D3C74_270350 [compost metagenome]